MIQKVLLLAGALTLLYCTKKIDPRDNSLYFYSRESIRTLDPIQAHDLFSQQVVAQVYESLLHFHYLKRPLQLEPLLAEKLPEISPDGLIYTIQLKKGVRFHPSPAFPGNTGREMTAADVVYSWKRLADPRNKSESYWLFQDKIIGLDEWREKRRSGQADYDTPVEGLQTPSTHTLVVRLKKPNYQLLYSLASPIAAVVPREVVEHFGPEFSSQAVGTGPFRLDNWIRNSRLTFVKNPEYRAETYPTEGPSELLSDAGKPLPFLDKIVWFEIVEEQPQWLTFLKGDLDIYFATKDYQAELLQEGQLKKIYADRAMVLELAQSTDVVFTSFNTENPYLRHKKVRQAMSLAFDNATSLEKFYNRMALPAHGPIPPNLEGYRASLKNPYSQTADLEKARRLLVEAGFPNGKGLPEFRFEMASTHSTARQMAEYFQQRMALLNVKIKLSPNSWPQFNEKIKNKKADIFDMSWNADYPDSENFLQLFYSKNRSPGPNSSNFSNPRFDQLYEKSKRLPPGPQRTALYGQMEDLLIEEAPWIPNVHRMRVVVKHPWLKNYKHEFMILDTMKYYRVDDQERARLKKNL